ncbi:hypothetical protein K9B35_12180 [Sphingomonas sp. R647]|uniref:hypothetical protein n=1 Tax=Sphingomonas sp. R647 TaxID=2875233 RepID=UPI001CD796AD|nr:hypothetical protein [Sphingomonas sp. R647]MCA1198728.1 hypothetical protein [Sphingomonas sp. R647]
MLVAMVLAAGSGCAAPVSCPSPQDVVAAFNAFEGDLEWDLQADASRESDDVVSVAVHRTRRVTDLRCTTVEAEQPTVACRGVLHRMSSRSRQNFRLIRTADGWRLEDHLNRTGT